MSGTAGVVLEPPEGAVRDYHDRKHRVFQRMYADQIAYRKLMILLDDRLDD